MPQNYVPVGPRELTCQECGTEYTAKSLSSRYCSRQCARRADAKKPGTPCTKDGCDTKSKAKGLCSTHYNQINPARYKRVLIPCACCGKLSSKESRAKRYENSYCSELCRDYHRWGARSCELPANHWAYMLGATCEWVQPAAFTCGWCEKSSFAKGNRNTYCTDECRQRAKRSRRRANQYGAHGTYSWAEVTRLWAWFGKACAYCRKPTALDEIQAEHVIALSRGGANNLGNLLPSCGPCNADKRELSMDEWRADRKRRNLPAVVTHWDAHDPLYAHLTEANYLLVA